MRPRANIQINIRIIQLKIPEKRLIQLVTIMLTSMNHKKIQPPTLILPDDGRHLDNLRTGPQDYSGSHNAGT